MDILGLAEVKWLESGNVQRDSHTFIYSGHKKEDKYGVGLIPSNQGGVSVSLWDIMQCQCNDYDLC